MPYSYAFNCHALNNHAAEWSMAHATPSCLPGGQGATYQRLVSPCVLQDHRQLEVAVKEAQQRPLQRGCQARCRRFAKLAAADFQRLSQPGIQLRCNVLCRPALQGGQKYAAPSSHRSEGEEKTAFLVISAAHKDALALPA